MSETDRFGKLIDARRIDLITYGKTLDPSKAIIGDAAVSIAAQAQSASKPLVIEALNFQKNKAELETAAPKPARLISSLACHKVASSIKVAAFCHGVEVIDVNPAYTSVIGTVNYAQQKGISVHQGAALSIACRGSGWSERPTVQAAMSPSPDLQGIGQSRWGRSGQTFGHVSTRRMSRISGVERINWLHHRSRPQSRD